jgi:hypothetical protein
MATGRRREIAEAEKKEAAAMRISGALSTAMTMLTMKMALEVLSKDAIKGLTPCEVNCENFSMT